MDNSAAKRSRLFFHTFPCLFRSVLWNFLVCILGAVQPVIFQYHGRVARRDVYPLKHKPWYWWCQKNCMFFLDYFSCLQPVLQPQVFPQPNPSSFTGPSSGWLAANFLATCWIKIQAINMEKIMIMVINKLNIFSSQMVAETLHATLLRTYFLCGCAQSGKPHKSQR